MRHRCYALILALSTSVGSGAGEFPDWFPAAPPLPSPTGRVVRASNPEELLRAAENLAPGETLLVADGEYRLPRVLVLSQRTNIVIRGASGKASAVILKGRGWDQGDQHDDILHIGACGGVTLADLTFADCRSYGVKVEAENAPTDIHIYRCRFKDIGVRALKGSAGNDPGVRAVKGSVRFCAFENTRIPPSDWLFGGDYISAIDMMALEDWTFSGNVFRNIRGRNGGGRAAIFIWVRSRRVLVEGNLVLNCDRGIAFGNPGSSTANQPGEDPVYVSDSSIVNNFISGGPDCGIELWHSKGLKVFHNSIYRPEQNWNRGIRIGAGVADTEIANNLVHGGIQSEGGEAAKHHNLAGRLDGVFLDPEKGDLRLNPRVSRLTEVVGRGAAIPNVRRDIQGKDRDERPDLGAWELED